MDTKELQKRLEESEKALAAEKERADNAEGTVKNLEEEILNEQKSLAEASAKIAELENEVKALKKVESKGGGTPETKQKVLSEKERTFEVQRKGEKKRTYRFDAVTHVWWKGTKYLVADLMKDEEELKQLADACGTSKIPVNEVK